MQRICLALSAQHSVNFGNQSPRLDRLCEVLRAASVDGCLAIDLAGVRRHGQDGYVRRFRVGLDAAGRLQPIHDGKGDVHDHQVRVMSACRLDAFETVSGFDYLISVMTENGRIYRAIIVVVFDEEYAMVVQTTPPFFWFLQPNNVESLQRHQGLNGTDRAAAIQVVRFLHRAPARLIRTEEYRNAQEATLHQGQRG